VIVLIGFMGAGKTTVGRRLAEHLGLEFVDADDVVAQRAGAPIAEIFGTQGEAGFRSCERTVVADLLRGKDAVVALGGGAPEDPETRAALRRARTVHLDVGFEEAMRRLGDGAGRPMLQRADPLALYARRRALYRCAADVSLATDGRAPDEVALEIARRLRSQKGAERTDATAEPARVRVAAGAPYDVVVGAGIADDLAGYIPSLPDAEKAFMITHPRLRGLAAPAARSLEEAGLGITWGEVEEGEGSKSPAVARRLHEALAEAELHRGDLVVGFGGGVVTDLAGYVASTYLRGVAVAHVASSLLGQVDAAIGGKTGVNLAAGKNLVGTIHQPSVVVCDVDLLATLPRAELVSGLAEVVKYGLIADPELLALMESRAGEIRRAEPAAMLELVARSAAIKAAVVAADERERGRRAHLNYGHTFAHAIEQAAGYGGIRHGEAVALGMMAAAHLARLLGRIGDDVVEAHRRALAGAGLPTRGALELEVLEPAWTHDKKYRRGVRFVLLCELGRPEAGVEAPRELVGRALERLAK
jgi:shikimate kinase/3-dehydroquinate synthase